MFFCHVVLVVLYPNTVLAFLVGVLGATKEKKLHKNWCAKTTFFSC